MTVSNRRIVLASRPAGRPKPSDFRFEEADMPAPGDGQVLLETIYLSLDPYMRGRMSDANSYAEPTAIGGVMVGATVARIKQSRHPAWKEGEIVVAYSGWQSHAVSNGSDLRLIDPAVGPISTGLGVLGMTGFTAYAGLRNIGVQKPEKPWWSPPPAGRSVRSSARSPRSMARVPSELQVARTSARS